MTEVIGHLSKNEYNCTKPILWNQYLAETFNHFNLHSCVIPNSMFPTGDSPHKFQSATSLKVTTGNTGVAIFSVIISRFVVRLDPYLIPAFDVKEAQTKKERVCQKTTSGVLH